MEIKAKGISITFRDFSLMVEHEPPWRGSTDLIVNEETANLLVCAYTITQVAL